jgi:hypothetical protein
MDYNNIRKLLDRYWEGESSLQEETQLRDFFAGTNVPEDLKPYQPLFQFFQMEQEKKLDGDFDERLVQKLETAEKPEVKIRKLPYYLMRIAAAGLLLFSIYFVNEQWNQPSYESMAAEEMTPEEVYAQTKQALLLVSAKLTKGTNVVNDGMSKMNKATHVIK